MDQAAGTYERDVQSNENDSETLHGLANSLIRLGRTGQAKVAARRKDQQPAPKSKVPHGK